MRRREVITLLGGAVVAWPLAARAQQPAMPGIGWLGSEAREAEDSRLVPFFRGGVKEARGHYRPGLATKTSNTPFGTPSCRRIGSRTSGDDGSAFEPSIMTPGGMGTKWCHRDPQHGPSLSP